MCQSRTTPVLAVVLTSSLYTRPIWLHPVLDMQLFDGLDLVLKYVGDPSRFWDLVKGSPIEAHAFLWPPWQKKAILY